MYKFTKSFDRVTTPPDKARPNEKTGLANLIEEIRRPAAAVVNRITDIRQLTAKEYETETTAEENKALKEAVSAKKKKLPYFIPSGFCPIHHNDATLEYNGVVQGDIDIKQCAGHTEARRIKARLEALKLPYVLIAFDSPTGYGLKILIATDNRDINRHAEAVDQVINELSKLLKIDKKLFDKLGASQPCYYSFDPGIYVNEGKVEELKIKHPTTPPARPKPGNYIQVVGDQSKARKAAEYLINNGIDVANSYNDYLRISAACFNAFGVDGYDIAQTILESSQAYLQSNYRANFSEHWKTFKNGTKANGGTIVNLAKKYGFQQAEPIKSKSTFPGIFPDIKPIKEYKVKKYVSEIQAELLQDILTHDRLQIHSATDTGKTTAIINLLAKEHFSKLQEAEIQKIIIPVPRKSLDFTKKIYAQMGISTAFIDGTAEEADIKAAIYSSRVIVCTYDSLYKLEPILSEALVVPDEIQKLINDNVFRSDTCKGFFELLSQSKKVCIISATPVLELCAGSVISDSITKTTRDSLNYRLIKITATKKQKKVLTPICYKGKRNDALMTHLFKCMEDEKPGRHILLLNDLKELETAAEVINKKFGADTVNILSSKRLEYSKESPILAGNISDQTKIILCTSYADAGIDFVFQVASIAQFGRIALSDRVQFFGRPRAKDGVNQELQIKLFFNYTDQDAATIIREFKEGVLFKGDETNALKRFKKALERSEINADQFNAAGLKFTNDLRKAGEAISVIFDRDAKEWKPSIIDIIAAQHANTEKILTTYGKIHALTIFDETIQIEPVVFLDNIERHQDAAELLTEKRKAEKDAQAEAFELFNGNMLACLEIVYHTCYDRSIRGEINAIHRQHRKMSDEAMKLQSEHPAECKKLLSPTVRYLKLMELSEKIRDLKQKDIPRILLNTMKESDYQRFINSIIELWRLNKKQKDSGAGLDAKDIHHAKESEGIKKAMRGKNDLTITQLKEIHNTVTGQRTTEAKVKARFKELYEIKYNKEKKTYFFVSIRTLSGVIDEAKTNRMPQQHYLNDGPPKTLKDNILQQQKSTKKLVII